MDNITRLKILLSKINDLPNFEKVRLLNESHLTDNDFDTLVNSLDDMIDLNSTNNIYYHEDDLKSYGYIHEDDIPDILTDDLELVDRWLYKRSECRIDLTVLNSLHKREELNSDDKALVEALLEESGYEL